MTSTYPCLCASRRVLALALPTLGAILLSLAPAASFAQQQVPRVTGGFPRVLHEVNSELLQDHLIACTIDDVDVVSSSCSLCPPGQAPAQVFSSGLEYDATTTSVCLDNLGTYSSQTGGRTASNYDATLAKWLLNGKYLRTNLQSQTPAVARFASPTNDFQIDPNGTSNADARQSTLWSSEVHLYHYINDFRKRFINDAFVNSLGLSAETNLNLRNRQYRPDLQGIVNSRLPWTYPNEIQSLVPSPWQTLVTANNFFSPTRQRLLPSEPLDSTAFDPEYVIAQYAGVAANWITAGNAPWPANPTWGTVGNLSWRTDVRPAILEGFKLWSAYRYSGKTELNKYAMRVFRRWRGSLCGGTNQPLCNKGWNIDNVMMYLDSADPALNNPTNPSWPASASDDTLLFPYGTNYGTNQYGFRNSFGGVEHYGPHNAELGGMLIAGIFYDISKEVGLGDYKADQLFWKTMSLLDPAVAIDMTTFAVRVQQAARVLFPVTGNPNQSWYEQDLVDVFTSRGVKMNGVANFLDNVPAALGFPANPGPGTLLVTNAVGFGSSIPESQRNSTTGYNFLSYFQNGYQVTTPGTQYVTYQFYKFSKYGPCDQLDLTNGTINITNTNNPVMGFDGSMAASYRGRSLGNTLIMAPGQTLRFLRRRQACVSEQDGYYAEDVRPFGFRAVKAIANGFTFVATRTGGNAARNSYRLTVVDPSLTLTGPNTGAAIYNWTFTEFNGTVVNATGQQVTYSALLNQPFTLSVTRVRGTQNDSITLRERGNDLHRNSGKQFNQDFWSPGYPTGFDTLVDRRFVEGHGSYNSALNPVGGAFGVQVRRWTTPNQKVQPLRFSTVSHGLGSGSNQGGAYRFQDAVYYNACIWRSRTNATNFPGCQTGDGTNGSDYQVQVPFSQVGINIGSPFASVTSAGYPGYLWTVNYPAAWRLDQNTEYHFASHISASVVNNGYSYNVCSYAQAPWDGVTAGNAADKSDWLAGANWSGQGGAPIAQTMRQYLASAGSVTNCTFAAYKFEGVTVAP